MTPGFDNPTQVATTGFGVKKKKKRVIKKSLLVILLCSWCHLQAMWSPRSRLDSARTVSESSEACSIAVDLEMNEDFLVAGSLKRRHREDSAYMSQRDSMSGGPPETPSPDIGEEDQNGYVLPGDSPERGDY